MGPLAGLRVLEVEGIGPAPFCGMLLADMGAEVIRVTRRSAPVDSDASTNITERGKRTIAVNLKTAEGVEIVLKLCEQVDVLFEGFRPGVAERLGIGPKECLGRNPRLVYGRMTGWGQNGPLAQAAGHDINYISLSGALHSIGRQGEPPVPPLNLVGDFGGGAMFLAFGLLCGVYEARTSGDGQVIDVSMVEGSAALMHMMYAVLARGGWRDERGVNILDGAAHFYDSYETADGKYVSLGSMEPQFYQLLIEKAGLDADEFSDQLNAAEWSKKKLKLAEIIRRKTRAEWCETMEGSDVCFAPVLSLTEAPSHPHNVARQSFIELEGVIQPAPTPKFSRTRPQVAHAPKPQGRDTVSVLRELGYGEEEIEELRSRAVLT